MAQFQKPKGTKDYYPEDWSTMQSLAAVFREQARRYGFSEVEAPCVETIPLLSAKQGEEIKEQIFVIEKKGGEDLGLRPDVTVPVTRMLIQKQKELPKPIKWFYITKVWRYERPQAGRMREFYQYGVELYGSQRPEADAEIIMLVIDSLRALGLSSKDIEVRLNNRNVLQALVEKLGVPSAKINDVIRAIDKREKIPSEVFAEELKKAELDGKKQAALGKFLSFDDVKDIPDGINGKEELAQLMKLLESRKEFVRLDLSTARGLAYYTGTVFEVFDKSGKFRSIAGGGRYDNLVALLGGEQCSACGFGIGFATLSLLLEEKKLLPKADLAPDYYIAPLSGKELTACLALADRLRKKGSSVEIDLMARQVGKQLDYANKRGAKNVIVVGSDEIKKGAAKAKDMKSGKEKAVGL